MIYFIFDLDDTIIIHPPNPDEMYNINSDKCGGGPEKTRIFNRGGAYKNRGDKKIKEYKSRGNNDDCPSKQIKRRTNKAF